MKMTIPKSWFVRRAPAEEGQEIGAGRMSLLNLILPTHAKLAQRAAVRLAGSPTSPALGAAVASSHVTMVPTGMALEELAAAQVALRDMIDEQDWKRAHTIAEHIAHRCKLLGYEQSRDAAGVVRH